MKKQKNCDICNTKSVRLDAHHIWSTALNGPDIEWNKCYICPNCHRKVHQGNIIIEGWFHSTKGRILVHRQKNDEPIAIEKDWPVYLISNS
jgi:uncharacterized protein YlaI